MAMRCIEPANGPLDAEFRAAPSKSATHRALVAAALASGTSTIRGPLLATDTRVTCEGVRRLGVPVEDRDGAWIVHGSGGAIRGGATIDLAASGTSARFLTALAALGEHPSTLDGSPRLRERPIEELIAALSALGATVEAEGGRRLPLRAGGTPVAGGTAVLSGARSSQFASALLLAAPAFARGLRLRVDPPRVSFSYVHLTVSSLAAFGAVIERTGEGEFWVPPQPLRPAIVTIEGDHSSASYALAAVAILGGRLRIRGLRPDSLQPDARFLGDLVSLGCRVSPDGDGVEVAATGRVPPFSWDLADAPDLAPTAAILAAFAEGPCVLSGLRHLAFKESDRLSLLRDNLGRLGAVVEVGDGSLAIVPAGRTVARAATIEVAGDHRMAMAFAIAGLARPGVTVDDAGAVGKSYPRFWDDLAELVRTGS